MTNKGFTLLEVMVAMAILSIGLVSIMGLFSSGLRSASLSQSYTLATMLARQKMEEIASQQEIRAETLGGDFEGDYSSYNWEVEINPYEFREEEDLEEEAKYNNFIIRMFKIITKISWEEGNKKRSVSLVTLKTVLEKELM